MKKIALLIILILVIVSFSSSKSTPTVIPTPTPKIFKTIENYQPPKINDAPSYTIIFLGDSMTAALGVNFDDLRKDLAVYYPKKVFGLFNYGFGASNILSADLRLNTETAYQNLIFTPILGRYFDIIIIESFAYNPLSDFPITEGLNRQNMMLDRVISEIVDAKPNSLIVFLATIAPSKTMFGKGQVVLTPEDRLKNITERNAYLQNHIAYAQKHNIPLINVYQQTLDKNGSGLLKYIDTSTHIHPSAAGVRLISQSIADFFNQNNLLPH